MRNKINGGRSVIREYIRSNPECTYSEIKKATKLKVERFYSSMKSAYEDAGVELSKNLLKRDKDEQKSSVAEYIRRNPKCSVDEIQKSTGVNIPRVFGSIINAYMCAGIEYPKKEITSGVRDPSVVKRCHAYEKEIIQLLAKKGKVIPKVRTCSGIVDCLFTYKNVDFVVEVKDFRARNNITMSQIRQLVKYMDDLEIKNGLLICPKESFPKRKNGRNIYIKDLMIQILSKDDLRGYGIKEKISVQPG